MSDGTRVTSDAKSIVSDDTSITSDGLWNGSINRTHAAYGGSKVSWRYRSSKVQRRRGFVLL